MKTFSDNLEVIEVKLKDKDGNEQILKARYLTIKDLKRFDEIINNPEKEDDGFDLICRRMAFVFGGKKEDYYKYSMPLINGVMEYVKDVYFVNPLKPAQK